MKTVIICAICEKPKKEGDSYALKVTDYRARDGFFPDRPQQRQVRVCRTCVKKMGYRVKTVKRGKKNGK